MNKGDKVKLSKTTETGVILNILRGDQVEVALDGWNSPQIFSKNELRIIEKPADIQVVATKKLDNDYEKGIFLAFVPLKLPMGEILDLYVINNTEWDLPFNITIDKTRSKIGLMAGLLKSGSYQKHKENLKIDQFDDWKTMTFSAIYHKEESFEAKAMLYVQKKFQASTFFQNKRKAPFLDQEAYLYSIEEKPMILNALEIREKMMDQNTISSKSISENIADEIDLHIEKLSKTYWRLSNAEIFALQLKIFEENLEKAIANGMDEIVFIHGIGEGKLEAAIHQKLKSHKNVALYFQASQQKYGTGATMVKIK
jgi:Domain of unknown function (DUF2027)/Smr domain